METKRIHIARNRLRSAITLLELLFSIAVLAALAFLVGASTPTATASRFKAEQLNRAQGLAQKELESIKSIGYPNITPDQLVSYGLIDDATGLGGNLYTFTGVDAGAKDNAATLLPQGKGYVLVEQVSTDVRRVTVSVTWSERGVTTRTVSIGTIVANI